MDIKELNKTQLVLLTLLITFVVSVATGIITVSLMQQMPDSVPSTINNVIQRTIEKVSVVQAPVDTSKPSSSDSKNPTAPVVTSDANAIVWIYPRTETTPPSDVKDVPKALGSGVIISDIGLILVDSGILNDKEVYSVMLDKIDFDATVLKKFGNGFAVLKISPKSTVKPIDPTPVTPAPTETPKP